MPDKTVQSVSKWAHIGAAFARFGGYLSALIMGGKNGQKAIDISTKVADEQDAAASALDNDPNQPGS